MNQQCKVCGEPAAGFHFGAFTCEGCKSFFGRSYNNLNSITECKNNGECIINKKNRTACKSCRLRKCLLVGMSKSGSRYGRRSNWFKIHCLLQEQQQAAAAQIKGKNTSSPLENPMPLLSPLGFPHSSLGSFLRPNNSSSPSVSSPDSDSSEPSLYSPRLNGTNPFVHKDFYLSVPFHSMFMHPSSLSSPFLLPPSLLPYTVPPTKHEDYTQRLVSPDHVQSGCKIGSPCDLKNENIRSDSPPISYSPTNNNEYSSNYKSKHNSDDVIRNKCNNNCNNNNNIFSNSTNNNNNNNNENKDSKVTVQSKRFYLDTILGLKPSNDSDRRSSTEELENGAKSPPPPPPTTTTAPAAVFQQEQDNPIDLSVKSSAYKSDGNSKEGEESDEEKIRSKTAFNIRDDIKPIPLDLSV